MHKSCEIVKNNLKFYSRNEEQIFSFFFQLCLTNFLTLNNELKLSIATTIEEYENIYSISDFLVIDGDLFDFFIFFNHGEGSCPNYKIKRHTKCDAIVTSKIKIKLYGAMTHKKLYVRNIRRVCSDVRKFFFSRRIVVRRNKKARSALRYRLTNCGLSALDANLISNLLPFEFIELLSHIDSQVFNVVEFHGSIYECLLNFSMLRPIRKQSILIGYQHGAVYGEWKNNILEQLEVDFFHKFNYWHQVGITRFNKFDMRRSNKIDKLVWVARPVFNVRYIECVNPYFVDHNKNLNSVVSVKNAVEQIEYLKCYIKLHPRGSNALYSNILKSENFKECTCSLEKIKLNDSLYIFDQLSQTFFYYCIKYLQPFLVITNIPDNDVTENFKLILNELIKIGVVVDLHEDGLESHVKDCIENVYNNWDRIIQTKSFKKIRVKYGL